MSLLQLISESTQTFSLAGVLHTFDTIYLNCSLKIALESILHIVSFRILSKETLAISPPSRVHGIPIYTSRYKIPKSKTQAPTLHNDLCLMFE